MDSINKKPQLIFIPFVPRSLSTIYLRTFMNCQEVAVYSDQFARIHIEEKIMKNNPSTYEELTKDLENQIEKDLSNGKTVIFKSGSFFVKSFYVEIIKKWQSKFNMKFLYLLRHPKSMYISYKKIIDEEFKSERGKDMFEFLKTMSEVEYYSHLWDLYNIFKGKVILTEDLQENPTKVFKESFEYCGLDFKEEVMTYEPLVKIGIPKEMEFFKNWYYECINSTTFKPGVTDIKSIVIEDEKAIERIKISEEFYEKFKEERKTK